MIVAPSNIAIAPNMPAETVFVDNIGNDLFNANELWNKLQDLELRFNHLELENASLKDEVEELKEKIKEIEIWKEV